MKMDLYICILNSLSAPMSSLIFRPHPYDTWLCFKMKQDKQTQYQCIDAVHIHSCTKTLYFVESAKTNIYIQNRTCISLSDNLAREINHSYIVRQTY